MNICNGEHTFFLGIFFKIPNNTFKCAQCIDMVLFKSINCYIVCC